MLHFVIEPVYLNVTDPPREANAIFILGGSVLDHVHTAAALYIDGFAPVIAFISTGGNFGGEKIWGMPENDMYQRTLLTHGVPQSAILSAGLTTNTLAEAQAAIPFLREQNVPTDMVILTSRPIHQRRAWATFQQQHPNTNYINCPSKERFNLSEVKTLQRLIAEMSRLEQYGARGDLVTQAVDAVTLYASTIVKEFLAST